LIGSATLIVGEPFKLGIYDRTDSQQISLNKGLQQSSVTKCWERSNTQGIITKNSIESGIRITATDASACLANKIGQLENDLIVVNLDYQSPDGGRPHFCISREGDTQ